MEEQQQPDAALGAQVAHAIRAADNGDALAAEQLFAALYGELHRMAKRQLHRNAYGSTLGATSLLHEAYLDMSGRAPGFPDQARFFAYTARAMRGLIIDHVRERRALKRGGRVPSDRAQYRDRRRRPGVERDGAAQRRTER